MSKTIDIGAVTAYAIAVKHGYTGTEQQWARDQLDILENAASARTAAENAAVSEMNADRSAQSASESAERAGESEAKAKTSEDNAAESERIAEGYKSAAFESANSAKQSENASTEAASHVDEVKQHVDTVAADFEREKAALMQDVETVKNALPTKANDSELQALKGTVNDSIEGLNGELETVKDALNSKAESTQLEQLKDDIVLYLTQVRDALAGGDILGAIAILDEAILDFSVLS